MKKINKTKEDWKKELTPEQFKVMFEHGTEAPFSGQYYLDKSEGVYHCAACQNPLFTSEKKFDTGCGWPSFYKPITKNAVEYFFDDTHDMLRKEVRCGHCGAHLGHVFNDAFDKPTGQRYCINSIALDLRTEK